MNGLPNQPPIFSEGWSVWENGFSDVNLYESKDCCHQCRLLKTDQYAVTPQKWFNVRSLWVSENIIQNKTTMFFVPMTLIPFIHAVLICLVHPFVDKYMLWVWNGWRIHYGVTNVCMGFSRNLNRSTWACWSGMVKLMGSCEICANESHKTKWNMAPKGIRIQVCFENRMPQNPLVYSGL